MQDKQSLVEAISADPDLDECLRYLILYQFDPNDPDPEAVKIIEESDGVVPIRGQITMKGIAAALNMSHSTLRTRISYWNATGRLKEARRFLSESGIEAIEGQIDRIQAHWAAVLEKQLHTALEGSEKNSLMAAAWLNQEVISKRLDAKQEKGSEEAQYLNNRRDMDFNPPMEIKAPKLKLNSG